MQTQLNLDALKDLNSANSARSIDELKLIDQIKALPLAEQKAQMAFFLGYLDNLAGAYSKASPEMQKKILSTMTGYVGAYLAVAQALYASDPAHNGDLMLAYTTVALKFGQYGDNPAQLMSALASCDVLTRGYALSALKEDSTFSLKDSTPTTVALFAEFMGSRNNNPSETTDIPVLEAFLGQTHAGVDCGSYLASFCNSYLQSADRDTNLFPTSTDDPHGYTLFKNTFRAPSNPDEEPNYGNFLTDLSDTIGTTSTDTPESIRDKMGERGWLDVYTCNPSVSEQLVLQSALSVDFMNIPTDSSNDGSDAQMYPDSCFQRI